LKTKKQTRVDATSAADALIAKVSRGTSIAPPSPAALAELRKVLDYNDATRAPTKRVSAGSAIEMMRGMGWQGSSKTVLDRVCRELGRRSYGTP
jgi:hypothetical protein